MLKIKTRFAPSPTGKLHLGSARTALYSWLFARNLGGNFILRIEDTDLERSKKSAIDNIIKSMKWLNLDWDEGPYFQSKRFNRYNEVVKNMLLNKTAYKCFCSKEHLKNVKKIQISKGEKTRYNGKCLNEINNHNDKKPYVIRFNNPKNGTVNFLDLIRGNIKFNNKELDDLIIRRTDGTYTYNFSVVVDDIDMKITHVIRGEDHINNTPRQINIFKALNYNIPTYAHLSMILGHDGKKLSKRHTALGVMEYRNNGYLPEAILNYLVRLGWSHGDQEIFNINEMKKLFNLNNVSKSASIFNMEKLLWLNHYYINNLPSKYVAKHLYWHFKKKNININNGPKLEKLIKLTGKRYKNLKDITDNSTYFYNDKIIFDFNLAKKYLSNNDNNILKITRNKLLHLNEWDPKSINRLLLKITTELKISMKKIGIPLRFAITGLNQSPPLGCTIYLLGKSKTISRINSVLSFIKKNN